MCNVSSENRPAQPDTRTVPPTAGCPTWCSGDHAPWTADVDEFVTSHYSEQLAAPGASYSLTLYALDVFYDGTLETRPTCYVLQVEDEFMAPEDAALLVADLIRADALAADTRRRGAVPWTEDEL